MINIPTYVKAAGRDTWHWCRNCSNYPAHPTSHQTLYGTQRPASGELCNECHGKERAGTCST